MSQDQARIYDAVGLCSGSNALMLQAVLVDHIGHATNAAQEFSAAIANFCRSWSTVSFRIKQTPEGVGQLEGFASDLSTLLAERVAALNSLTEMHAPSTSFLQPNSLIAPSRFFQKVSFRPTRVAINENVVRNALEHTVHIERVLQK